MKRIDIFPSKYFKSDELNRPITVTVREVKQELVGAEKERRAVCYFDELDKGIVLNVTNWTTLEEAYGEESDDWIGEKVVIIKEKVAYAGRRVDGLRLRISESAPERGFISDAREEAPF